MKKALIFQGKLVETAAESFPVSPEMQWVDVADDVTPETHQYNGTSVVINPPKPTSEVKADAVSSINAARSKALLAGFTHEGQQYHTDAVFQAQLQAFLLAWQVGSLASTATVSIRRKDNVTVLLGQTAIHNLAAALMQHVQSIYVKSWSDKDAL